MAIDCWQFGLGLEPSGGCQECPDWEECQTVSSERLEEAFRQARERKGKNMKRLYEMAEDDVSIVTVGYVTDRLVAEEMNFKQSYPLFEIGDGTVEYARDSGRERAFNPSCSIADAMLVVDNFNGTSVEITRQSDGEYYVNFDGRVDTGRDLPMVICKAYLLARWDKWQLL